MPRSKSKISDTEPIPGFEPWLDGQFNTYVILAFNFLVFAAGVVLMSMLSHLRRDPAINYYLEIVAIDHNAPMLILTCQVLTVIAVFMLLIACFGICSASRESRCCILVYIGLLGSILVGQLIAAVMISSFKSSLGPTLKASMVNQVSSLSGLRVNKHTDSLMLAWHNIQTTLECCGGQNYKDYRANPHYGGLNPVPFTCCKLHGETIRNVIASDLDKCFVEARKNHTTAMTNELHIKGCHIPLEVTMLAKCDVILSLCVGLALSEVVVIMFAVALSVDLHKKERTSSYHSIH